VALLEKCRATADQESGFKERWDLAWKRAQP
jgi:hypothetical protein